MKIMTIECSFDNYAYLLICEQTGVAAVIDPSEFYPVYQVASRLGVEVRYILCTHHHHDHIGGITELLDEYGKLPVYGFKGDRERIQGLTHTVEDEDEVLVGNLVGKVLHTPGHTAGSICYHFENSVFTGDTLFGCGCGRLFEGTPEEMYTSLMEKIAGLPGDTYLYFGHEYTALNLKFANFVEPGNPDVVARMSQVKALRDQKKPTSPSALDVECRTNPFLRCNDPEFVRSVCKKLICKDPSPQTAFAALRKLRDGFS